MAGRARAAGGIITHKAPNVLSKNSLASCMRKLLTILNAILKHRTPWREVEAAHALIQRQLLTPYSSP